MSSIPTKRPNATLKQAEFQINFIRSNQKRPGPNEWYVSLQVEQTYVIIFHVHTRTVTGIMLVSPGNCAGVTGKIAARLQSHAAGVPWQGDVTLIMLNCSPQ